jgi:MFS family permease
LPSRTFNWDFWKFLTGQTISNFGGSITAFALPLLVFKLTGSAINLALASAATFLPYLLFGLVIGAWTDRVDRKRLMIVCDVGRALVIASIPAAYLTGHLSVWWIYAAAFVESTFSIAFNAGQFAAVPSLVESDDLVTANGRLQAAYEAASITGPFLAGVALLLVPLPTLFTADAASFVISAVSLGLVRRSFNAAGKPASQHILRDIRDGLRYVLGHPVLRMISAMMALFNFFNSSTYAQVVLFSKDRLAATDTEIGWLFAAASVATIIFSLNAGRLRRRFSFSQVILGVLAAGGLLMIVFSQQRGYLPALLIWSLWSGILSIFDINTMSLRQAIVPNEMMGRVLSIAGVLAWSAIPLGTLAGGVAIQWTGHVEWVFLTIGVLTFVIPVAFAFTPLGRAEKFVEIAARGRAAEGTERAAESPAGAEGP